MKPDLPPGYDNPVRHTAWPGKHSAAWLWQYRGPPSEWHVAGYASEHGEKVERDQLPRIAVLVIGDGRDAIRQQTLLSFCTEVYGYRLAEVVEVDDRRHDLGFCGAIQAGWDELRRIEQWNRACGGDGGWEYVFHLEEDWRFTGEVDVRDLATVLDMDPSVAQVALRRGPVNDYERRAGGVVECWPHEYEQCAAPRLPPGADVPYLRHQLFWTTNPSLYRMELLGTHTWPSGPGCEDAFGAGLRAEGRRFAYAGARADAPLLHHNGARTGTGY